MRKLQILCLVLGLCFSVYLQSQEGILDISFGNNGLIITDVNTSNDVAQDMLVQADGKIIVAGYTSDGIKDFFCLMRYNIDGSKDFDFGDNGIVVTEFASTSVGASMAIQTDGKILLGGHTWGGEANGFALARYHSNGSLDTDFGIMGKVTTLFPNFNAIGRSIAIQADGKIILGGRVYTLNNDADDFAIARYFSNGTLDSSFGENGMVTTSFGPFTMDWLNDLELQADGKIIAAGFTGSSFAMARYLVDGSLDSLFGIDGLLITNFEGTEHGVISSIKLLSQGNILAAGFIRDSFSNFALMQYRSNGDVDESFGTNGILITTVSDQSDGINAIKIQDDGKIIAGGTAYTDTHNQFKLARYHSDGSLDVSFGENGITNAFNSIDGQLTDIALQTDGKILACGFSQVFPYDFILSRYTSNVVGIKEVSTFPGTVTLYPNPVQDFVMLDYQLNTFCNISIDLLNAEGKLLENIMDNESCSMGQNINLIDLSELPSGTYFVAVRVLDKVYSYEVVKQ